MIVFNNFVKIYLPLCLLLILSLFACKKEGIGGTAGIKGNAHLYIYDEDNGELKSDHSYIDEDIYIIYGDDPNKIYDDVTTTSYNGNFQFNYLYPGKFTIFSYSDCANCPSGKQRTQLSVEVLNRGQTLLIDTLRLYEFK